MVVIFIQWKRHEDADPQTQQHFSMIPSMFSSQELRRYTASAIWVILILALLGVLMVFKIPPENRDLSITIISVLVGATGTAFGNLFGSESAETRELKAKVQEQHEAISRLQAQYATVKDSYDRITSMLIQRHVVEAEGIEGK